MTADPDTQSQVASFILANTRPMRPPLVPEIVLNLAEESVPIWQKTEEELGEMNVPPPYWAFAWAGGQALARYILDVPECVAGKTVLDIGSGSGLVALAAKLAGATSVVANDIDEYAIAACALNAQANGVTIEMIGTDLMDCGMGFEMERDDQATSGDAAELLENVDVVCLGDTFYEQALAIEALLFAESAQNNGARVLVGDPNRSYFPKDQFDRLAEYSVPVTRELEDSEIKRTSVWQLK